MTKHVPNPNALHILIHDTPKKAVQWAQDYVDVTSVDIAEAHIVLGGMESGLASVDIVTVDSDGTKRMGMLTGALIKQLALAIAGAEQRT